MPFTRARLREYVSDNPHNMRRIYPFTNSLEFSGEFEGCYVDEDVYQDFKAFLEAK